MQFLSQIYALFLRTFYRPKKYGGVPKMTNMRYALKTHDKNTFHDNVFDGGYSMVRGTSDDLGK